jgi:putative thioredoxin
LAGYDLSKLIKPAEPETPVASVNDLVMVGVQGNIKTVVQLSGQVPVVLEFHATDANSLRAKLETAVRSHNGKVVLVRIDAQKEAEVAAAFGVTKVPTVMALLKGQPVPLFEGDIDEATVKTYVEKLLEAAAKNGISGSVSVGEPSGVSALQERAYAAIEAGDLALAKTIYADALADNPRNAEAIAGIAQVELMERVADIDFDAVLGDPNASPLTRADALVAIGEFERGFAILLADFAVSKSEEIKTRLLALFEVAGATTPEVIAARKQLTMLLY